MNIHLQTALDLNWDENLETGSVKDVRSRLEATLPAGWFPYASSFTGLSLAPLLDGALSGASTGFSWVYYFFQYILNQTRLASMSGGMLDLASYDFFNYNLLRLPNEADAAFLIRIVKEFLRIRNTRQGVTSIVTDITGRAPKIIEPWNPYDTGAYGQPQTATAGTQAAYGASGAYGGDPYSVYTYGPDAGAGYGRQYMICQSGVIVYRPTDQRLYSDAMLYAGLERVRTAGTILWVKFSNAGVPIVDDAGAFIVDESGNQFVSE